MNAIAEVERLARELVKQNERMSEKARKAVENDDTQSVEFWAAQSDLEAEIEKHDRATKALDLALIQLDIERS